MEASPSRTAIMAAVVRGRHRLEDAPPWILDDPIALELVGPSWQDMAASSDARFSAELGRQIRAAIAIRSRYAEHRLELGDFRQYVLLGAGLDSFRWRRPDLLGPLRLFEVDHPASQAWKRERMGELGLEASEYQVFAPVDFEVESLGEGLDAAGFDWEQPTLFSWLGVIPYLTIDCRRGHLADHRHLPFRLGGRLRVRAGASRTWTTSDGSSRAGFSPLATRVGEPLRTGGGWSPAEAEEIVRRCGLRVVDHPSREDLVGRYFSGQDRRSPALERVAPHGGDGTRRAAPSPVARAPERDAPGVSRITGAPASVTGHTGRSQVRLIRVLEAADGEDRAGYVIGRRTSTSSMSPMCATRSPGGTNCAGSARSHGPTAGGGPGCRRPTPTSPRWPGTSSTSARPTPASSMPATSRIPRSSPTASLRSPPTRRCTRGRAGCCFPGSPTRGWNRTSR